MSALLANFLRISLPFSFFTSMVRLRLLRLSQTYPDDNPLTTESQERMTSPTPGRSTLITSAPMSASRQVANGPESTCSKARILTPSSARMTFELLATLTSFSVQRFERLELFERFERDLFFSSLISGNKSRFGACAFFQ